MTAHAYTGSAPDTIHILRQMIHGYTVSQTIYVAAKLGIADHLSRGSLDCNELSRRMATHPQSLYRLMRALASLGLFYEDDERRFALTDLGQHLRTDSPDSLRSEVLLFGAEPYRVCGELLHSVTTGETAFDYLFKISHLEYLSQHRAAGTIYNEAMTQITTRVSREVVENYDFSETETLVDVGGGHGIMLATILKSNSRMKGILYDLAHAFEGGKQMMEREGVLDRAEIITGDALDSVPPHADVYMMKSVLHLLDDEAGRHILTNCRRAMTQKGKLLLIERVIPVGNSPFWGKFVDIVMMAMTGGRERTETEYDELLAATDFVRMRTISLPSGFAIIDAVCR